MTKNLGASPDMPSKGGFSFADSAAELANDLIHSLVIDVTADLDFEFGLDISPIFNTSANGILDRMPDPFIQINEFNLGGETTLRIGCYFFHHHGVLIFTYFYLRSCWCE